MSYKTGKKKIAASYRVNEPIRNLRIRARVVQQRSPLAELLEEEAAAAESETRDSNFLVEEDRIFGWQEKVLSPFEIDFYADEKNCLTDCQRDYHRRIIHGDGNADGDDERPRTGRLYSYTENDPYYPDDDLLTSEPYRSYLSARSQTALPVLRNRKPFRERYDRRVVDDRPADIAIRSNHYLYTERNAMYVMVDLSRRDVPAPTGSDAETLLCSVTYDRARKLLTISPDFTGCGEHYDVTNGYGIKYNYWLEHVSEERTPLELQRRLEDTRREVQQQLAFKEAELYKELQSTPANTSTIFLYLDIVSARGFSYDGLFITYFIDLPQRWSTKQRERLYGRTQKCRLKNKSAHFNYCTDVSLHYPSSAFSRSSADASSSSSSSSSSLSPRLLFSVASLDSWTRYRVEGYAALPLPLTPGAYGFTVPTWRARGNFVDVLRRFFVGGSHELEDITYCGVPDAAHDDQKTLDKSNLRVVSSGDIEIRVNIVRQDRALAKHFDYRLDDTADRAASTDALVNNVESILEQFKAAKERMIQIRSMNP